MLLCCTFGDGEVYEIAPSYVCVGRLDDWLNKNASAAVVVVLLLGPWSLVMQVSP